MFTKVKFILIITVLCLTIPFAALAKKPEKGEFSGFFAEEQLIDCGDYWILDDMVFEVSSIYFFDRHGNWIRTFDNYRIYNDLYREGKPIHVTGIIEFHTQAYIEDDEWVYEQRQGLFFQATVPGYGNLLVQTGRIMRDADGFFFETPNGDFNSEALCDYLRQE